MVLCPVMFVMPWTNPRRLSTNLSHTLGLIENAEDMSEIQHIAEQYINDKNIKYWLDRVKNASKGRNIQRLLIQYQKEMQQKPVNIPELISRAGSDFMLLAKELAAWKRRQNIEKVGFDGDYNPLGLVFCTEAGEPINPEFISRTFKRDLGNANLPDIRFHDLRHGHATQLLELGEDITVISNRLGHSTITLTADTYSHVRETLQKEASDKLGKVLALGKKRK